MDLARRLIARPASLAQGQARAGSTSNTGHITANSLSEHAQPGHSNQVQPINKIEEEIEHFVENFKKKSSVWDRTSRISIESGDSSGLPSSLQYSTDEFTDDSPDRTSYLFPGHVYRHKHRRKHWSTTNSTASDSELAGDENIMSSKYSEASAVSTGGKISIVIIILLYHPGFVFINLRGGVGRCWQCKPLKWSVPSCKWQMPLLIYLTPVK